MHQATRVSTAAPGCAGAIGGARVGSPSDFRIAQVNIPYTYAEAQSSITMKDNAQLAWAALYHAAALARLLI